MNKDNDPAYPQPNEMFHDRREREAYEELREGLSTYDRGDSRDVYFQNMDRDRHPDEPYAPPYRKFRNMPHNHYIDTRSDYPAYSRYAGSSLKGRGYSDLYEPRLRKSFRGLGPKNYQRSDDRIMEDFCDQLTDNDFIDAREINVDVQDGNLSLSGSVSDKWMKYAAEDVAEYTHGVRRIENNINVRQPQENEASAREFKDETQA